LFVEFAAAEVLADERQRPGDDACVIAEQEPPEGGDEG
jgi:hypothetical protein